MSDARGDTVRIRDFCFGPTILRVHPGAEVRFLNADSTPHTVMGANASWGSFRQLNVGKHITYRFTRPGIYPYVCTWHPGMVGAVVVGGGPRMATGVSTTASGPVVQVLPQPRIEPGIAAAPAIDGAAEPAPISARVGRAVAGDRVRVCSHCWCSRRLHGNGGTVAPPPCSVVV